MLSTDCVFTLFCFQIRVVNAFHTGGLDPATPNASLPYRGRPSLATLVNLAAAKAAAAESKDQGESNPSKSQSPKGEGETIV